MNFNLLVKKYLLLVVITAWVISYVSQLHYDSWKRYSEAKIAVSYNEYIEPQPLSSDGARLASFGATEFMADLYWLQLIQYYGGGNPYGKYRKLAELFTTVTDLSPSFKQAYITGLVILPGEGFIDEAIVLGETGQKNLPDSWEMPYYTGLVHHIYKKDYATAGEKFTLAAELPGAPPITKLFAGIYFKEANQRKTAFLIFQTLIETSEDEFVIERAIKHLSHLSGLFTLEDAVSKYQTDFGKLPKNLPELVTAKILDKIPVSPFGVNYLYDNITGEISEGKN